MPKESAETIIRALAAPRIHLCRSIFSLCAFGQRLSMMLIRKANVTRRALIGKLRRFARRPVFEQAWFIPAWLLLGLSRACISFLSFRILAPRLGMHVGIAPWVPLIDSRDEARARSIARVVAMAARHTPWTSNCFPQALTARILLGLYGIPYCMFLGVSREQGTHMHAHAWVVSGRVAVSGNESFGCFTVVGCFASPRLDHRRCLLPSRP